MCDQLFPCATPSRGLLKNSLSPTPAIEGRTTCDAATNLCPTVSIGCALCGIFLPGQCTDQCIIAGLYCGVSAYACKAKTGNERMMMHRSEFLFPAEQEIMKKVAKMGCD